MMLWTDFFDYILPELPGIAQPLAEHYLRNVAIEFCDTSHLHVVDLTLIDVTATQPLYPLISQLPETEVSMVRMAWYDSVPLSFATLETLNAGQTDWALRDADRPIAFTQFDQNNIRLYPIPRLDLVGGLKIQAALRPTRVSTGVDDWVGNAYYDTIAKGAMGKLMLQPGKPWTNIELGSHYQQIYDSGKGDATIDANRSNTRATVSVQMRPAVISGRRPVMRR